AARPGAARALRRARERVPRRDRGRALGGRRRPLLVAVPRPAVPRDEARRPAVPERLGGPPLDGRGGRVGGEPAPARARGPKALGAVVCEPVLQAAGEMRLYSPDLLARLRRWADARGVYLIADEIAAGMGRLGAILASHLASGPGPASAAVLPDFATLSKGLTGGVLPLSAVLTTDAVASLFEGEWAEGRAFLHSNTYTGNAL